MSDQHKLLFVIFRTLTWILNQTPSFLHLTYKLDVLCYIKCSCAIMGKRHFPWDFISVHLFLQQFELNNFLSHIYSMKIQIRIFLDQQNEKKEYNEFKDICEYRLIVMYKYWKHAYSDKMMYDLRHLQDFILKAASLIFFSGSIIAQSFLFQILISMYALNSKENISINSTSMYSAFSF